jgi:hypothetical protein
VISIDFKPKDVKVVEVRNESVDRFLEKKHYLQSVPAGAKHRFKFCLPVRIDFVGAAMWGRPVARMEDQKNTLELTRFWTDDYTPKNTESYVLGKMMRVLREKGYDRLIAYSSTGEEHEGTIYKATNWEKVKETDRSSSWENREGRKDRDKSPKIKFEKVL